MFLGRHQQPDPRSLAAAGKASSRGDDSNMDMDGPRALENTAQALLDGLGEGIDPVNAAEEDAEDESRRIRREQMRVQLQSSSPSQRRPTGSWRGSVDDDEVPMSHEREARSGVRPNPRRQSVAWMQRKGRRLLSSSKGGGQGGVMKRMEVPFAPSVAALVDGSSPYHVDGKERSRTPSSPSRSGGIARQGPRDANKQGTDAADERMQAVIEQAATEAEKAGMQAGGLS